MDYMSDYMSVVSEITSTELLLMITDLFHEVLAGNVLTRMIFFPPPTNESRVQRWCLVYVTIVRQLKLTFGAHTLIYTISTAVEFEY